MFSKKNFENFRSKVLYKKKNSASKTLEEKKIEVNLRISPNKLEKLLQKKVLQQ